MPDQAFQASSTAQGREYEAVCTAELAAMGLTPLGPTKIPGIGIEVDQRFLAKGGVMVWIECKGSRNGSRPGLLRTDSMKKAIANGALSQAVRAEAVPPIEFWVISSHLPSSGASFAMMRTARDLRLVDRFLSIPW